MNDNLPPALEDDENEQGVQFTMERTRRTIKITTNVKMQSKTKID
jgi:hypothetical protein